MLRAQPLKYDGATRLLEAKQHLEGVKYTYPRRNLVGLANARCQGARSLATILARGDSLARH